MTEETEKQDFRLELAQKVRRTHSTPYQFADHSSAQRCYNFSANVQVFLYKSTDVQGTDKTKLQNQILDTILSNGRCSCSSHRGVQLNPLLMTGAVSQAHVSPRRASTLL